MRYFFLIVFKTNIGVSSYRVPCRSPFGTENREGFDAHTPKTQQHMPS